MRTKLTSLILLLSLSCFYNKSYGNDLTADSLQLVVLYNAMGGADWAIPWDLTQPVSTWSGVQLSNDGCKVVGISQATNNNIIGTIPDLNLPNLADLRLYPTELIGGIPDFSGIPNLSTLHLGFIDTDIDIPNFSNLPMLIRLDIRGTNSSATIPDFSNLPVLQFLMIRDIDLSSPLPNLTNAPLLIDLVLTGCNYSGSIPNYSFSQLQKLHLFNNNLTGSIPDFNLAELKYLDLSRNQLSGPLTNFSQLPNLITLSLDNNQFSGNIPDFNLANLTGIDLSFNLLDGNIPDFSGLAVLRSLELHSNQLSGTIPDFTNLVELRSLHLYDNQLTGQLFEFTNLPNLSGLYLGGNQLTGNLISYNNSLNLRELNLDGNQLSGTIPNAFASLVLERLNLSNNQFTGSIPEFSNNPSLISLSLAKNQLTGEIPNFNLPVLMSCDLSYNNLTGNIPDFNLISLFDFSASNNQLSGSIPGFTNIPFLILLILSDNQLSGCYHPNLCNISIRSFTNNPELPNSGDSDTFNLFCTDNASQYGQPCDDGNPNTIGERINSNCECAVASHVISGNIFKDFNENCDLDSLDFGLENWLVKYEEFYPNYANTDSLGNYTIYLDSGTYHLSLITPNLYWDPCFVDTILVLNDQNDSLTLDFPVKTEFECSVLRVDVSTPFLRRCFPADYTISYCNEGTIPETNAYVEVSFDQWLTVLSSSVPWTSQVGNTFTFPIGQVGIGECGNIVVQTEVACDSTLIGQTHCVEAHIFPDSICLPPNTLWDGSTIVVDGICNGDSINFLINNIGEQDMSMPLNYIVIEDQIIHLNGTFQLQMNETYQFTVPTNGATYRLEADQAAYHPTGGMPAVTVAGCNNGPDPISLGFVNFFGDPDQDPFVSIDCQQNIGSFDPNDKRGFPKGIGADHIIYPDTDLEYHIRFQNTGTDTAFNILIRDTISNFLNLGTLRPGASSHEYQWQLFPDNMIEFRFYDIMLPDSNVNEAASHGFVKFKIKQQADNLPGTLIENRAAIYFDFNDPILTNIAMHQIADKPILTDTIHAVYCETPFYSSDTVVNVLSNLSSYEIESTNVISIIGGQQSTIDTALLAGISFNGVLYENDTTLYQIYEAVNGCDSVVTINLDILVDLQADPDHFSSLSVVPNPSKGKVYLLFEAEESMNLELELYSLLGKKIETDFRLNLSKGQQLIPLDFSKLSNGLYLIQLNIGNKKWAQKLMIHK